MGLSGPGGEIVDGDSGIVCKAGLGGEDAAATCQSNRQLSSGWVSSSPSLVFF